MTTGLFPDRRLDAKEIASELEMSVRHFKERIAKEPGFPKPYKIGRSSVWMEKDVKSWILKQRER